MKLKEKKPWTPHQSFGGLILQLAAKMSKRGKEVMKLSGLGQISYGKLGVLASLLEEPNTQAMLCKKLGQSAPSMMEMLERLYQKQWVSYRAHASDGRKTEWFLTVKGKKVTLKAQEAFQFAGKNLDRFFRKQNIKKSEIERFKEMLRLLIEVYYPHYTVGEIP